MDRREFVLSSGLLLFLNSDMSQGATAGSPIKVFLCGDVMTGRGIDQVLPTPSAPELYESYVRDARQYVEIAERSSGPIPRPVDFSYPWGDALAELEAHDPDLRIVNLETAVTASNDFWPGKGIHYRMHPDNVPLLTAAGIDCCVLANNHTLDWGRDGLDETLSVLEAAGLEVAGCGGDIDAARAPAILRAGHKGRVLVFACALPSSGVPPDWAAGAKRSGVFFLPDLSDDSVRRIASLVEGRRREGDVVILSIHWGGNWGYAVPGDQREFAHRVIDEAGIDIVHGHSSHHPKAIEVYRERPIFYGCGDFLNDYEGIGGHDSYRPGLVLMYLVSLEAGTGRLQKLTMVPFEIRRFRLERASAADAGWLRKTMDRECGRFGGSVEMTAANRLRFVSARN